MIRSIVEEHAAEAALLWNMRARAAVAANTGLDLLASIDKRLDRHIRGLQVAGPRVWEVCAEVLPLKKPGEVFVVAALALHEGAYEELARILDAAGLDPIRARGIVSAIGWTPLERVRDTIDAFLSPGGPPALMRMGIAGALLHRVDPGPALLEAMESSDPSLAARALRAAGELGRLDLVDVVRDEVAAPSELVSFWAAWSAAILGDRGALSTLWRVAEEAGPFASRAVDVAARLSGVAATRAALDRLEPPSDAPPGAPSRRVHLQGAIALGESASVSRLLASLRIPSLARLAGSGLRAILGIDTSEQRLTGQPLPGCEASVIPDPAGGDAVDPDHQLPWPDAEAIAAACARRPMTPGVRYLAGEPISGTVAEATLGALERILRRGTQTERAAGALESALQAPGSIVQEVRGRGFAQRWYLGAR